MMIPALLKNYFFAEKTYAWYRYWHFVCNCMSWYDQQTKTQKAFAHLFLCNCWKFLLRIILWG